MSLDPEQEKFWKFSFDQMGWYDLPAMLEMVLGHTGQQQVIYLGHSMGTMAVWIMINSRPWMNAKVASLT